MAVNLIAPTDLNVQGSSVQVVWSSPSNEYCWDNFINAYDSNNQLIDSSGNFNPNGGDSIYTINGLPEDDSVVSLDISCNPNHTQTIAINSLSLSGSTTSGNTDSGETTTGTNTITTVILDDGIPEELRDEIISSGSLILCMSIGYAVIYRMLK